MKKKIITIIIAIVIIVALFLSYFFYWQYTKTRKLLIKCEQEKEELQAGMDNYVGDYMKCHEVVNQLRMDDDCREKLLEIENNYQE